MGDIYVSKSGDDATGDGRVEAPYLTIATALSNAGEGDRIIISTGIYAEYGLNKSTTKKIKILSQGDGDVTIDGNTGGLSDDTIRPYSGWVIDGSTGSYDFTIIGAGDSCVTSYSSTTAFKLKNITLTGRGIYTNEVNTKRTGYAVTNIGGTNGGDLSNEIAEIKNCFVKNVRTSFIKQTSTISPIKISNCVCYDGGYSGNTVPGLDCDSNNTEIYHTVVSNYEGGIGISSQRSDGSPIIKNCIVANSTLSDSAFYFKNSSTNISTNNSYNNGSPTNGGFYNNGGDEISANRNVEKDPSFNDSNNKDFSLKADIYHYPGSSRLKQEGSPLNNIGTDISGITTGISGSSRGAYKTIGAYAAKTSYLYSTAPTAVTTDKVKKDFTINHFNRISAETPRTVDQIQFSRLIKGVPNLKDTTKSYRLTKESK